MNKEQLLALANILSYLEESEHKHWLESGKPKDHVYSSVRKLLPWLKQQNKNKHKLLGYAAVDSGQILIVDPCYLDEWKGGESRGDNHYAIACTTTMSKDQGGEMLISNIAGRGVVASSGYGDGNYPVYAEYINTNKKGELEDIRIKSLTIEFL